VYPKLGNLITILDVQSFRKLGHIAAKQLNCEPQYKLTANELNFFFLQARQFQSIANFESSKLTDSNAGCVHANQRWAEVHWGQLTKSNNTESDSIDPGLRSDKPDSIAERTLPSQMSAYSKCGPFKAASTNAEGPTSKALNCEGLVETAKKSDAQDACTRSFNQGTNTYMTCRISVKNSFFHVEDDDHDDDDNELHCKGGKDDADRHSSQRSTSVPSRTISVSTSTSFSWGFPSALQLPVVDLKSFDPVDEMRPRCGSD